MIKKKCNQVTDINKAVELYPSLKTDKRVKKCPLCEKYFHDDSKKNNRKYCSTKCSKQAKKNNTIDKRYEKLFVQTIFNPADDKLQNQRDYLLQSENMDFRQDDEYWKLGTGNLTEHARTDNFDKEKEYILKELRRLKLR